LCFAQWVAVSLAAGSFDRWVFGVVSVFVAMAFGLAFFFLMFKSLIV